MKRILIVGLDGASPHLVRRWQESLPNLRRLTEEGAHGVLHSVIPPRSIPAWYCLATGVNPAKLGVFGFSQRRPGTYDYTFANSTHCRAPAFWEWLGANNICTALIHVPGTYPPRSLKGYMVSGWPGPVNRGQLVFTYPDRLSREIDTFLGKPFEAVSSKRMAPNNDAAMLAERLRILQMHGDVAQKLLSEKEWRVALAVFSPLDRASHQFWRHMDENHPRHDPDLASELGDALLDIYRESDRQLGRLLTLLDEDDWIFVVSDHGFGPTHSTFYLNEWLRREGYLVLNNDNAVEKPGLRTSLVGRLAAPLFWMNQRSAIFRRLSAPLKKRAFSNYLRDEYVREKEQGTVRINHLPVDWTRTRAYCPDESSLYLNLRGRDPQGLVKPGREATQLLDEIENHLREIRVPQTGRSVTTRVWRKEEIYSGPFLSEAPDLILAMDDFRTSVMAEMAHGELFDESPLWSGNHTPQGLFIARGPDIPARSRLDANIIDLVPTLFHMLVVPLPKNLDGEILWNLFNEESALHLREATYLDTGRSIRPSNDFTDEEMAEVEKQLRDLGYLS